MRHRTATAIALLAAAACIAPAAWGADMEGRIQSVDTSERTVTLDNGTKVWLADSVAVDSVKAGDEVKVSYEEKDGKPVAVTIETK
jgi:predicted phage tail protein